MNSVINKTMNFSLSPSQVRRFEEWKRDLPKASKKDDVFAFLFTPTEDGDLISIRRNDGELLILV